MKHRIYISVADYTFSHEITDVIQTNDWHTTVNFEQDIGNISWKEDCYLGVSGHFDHASERPNLPSRKELVHLELLSILFVIWLEDVFESQTEGSIF